MDILTNHPPERIYLDLQNLPHNLVAVRINDSIKGFKEQFGIENLNEAHIMAAAQQAWRIAESTAEKAEYVLAVVKEDIPDDKDHFAVRVVGVFLPISFGVFTPTSADDSKPARRSFLGFPAPREVAELYLNRYLKDIARKDQQPVRVLNKKSN